MKRFILGVICGALLFGGTSVLAESISLVGKTIDTEIPVYFNEEPLAAKAIAVEGTSYLPVRTVGNTLGATIEYRDGAVYVEQADQYEVIKEKVLKDLKLEMQREEIQKEISKLQTANENLRKQVSVLENSIEVEPVPSVKENMIKIKENTLEMITQNEQKIAELQAQLAELEGQEDGENQDQE